MSRDRCHLPGRASADEKRARLASKKILRLRDAQIQRITGRQMYVSHMAAKYGSANALKVASGSRHLSWKTIWSLHGTEWASLGPDQRRRFESLAAGLRASRHFEVESEVQRLQLERNKLHEQLKDVGGNIIPMSFKSCKLSLEDVADLGCYTPVRVPKPSGTGGARHLLQACATPMNEQDFLTIGSKSDLGERTIASAELVRTLCALRNVFLFGVLEAVNGEDTLHFLITLMVQRPAELVLLHLTEIETEEAERTCKSSAMQGGHAVPRASKSFQFDPGAFAESHMLESLEECTLNIYSNCLFCGEHIIAAFSGSQPLQSVLNAHEREGLGVKASRASAGSSSKRQASAASSHETSWIYGAFARGRGSMASAVENEVAEMSDESDRDEGEREQDIVDKLFEEVSTEVYGRYDAGRGVDDEAYTELFNWQVLGGAWQRERTGRNLYGVRVNIRPDSALHVFATRFGLGCSSSFEYNIYTEVHAEGFARVWAGRILKLYDEYLASEESVDWNGSSCMNSELPAELEDVLASLTKRAQTRVRKIVALRP
eukprot:6490953-Amphidinium_carterae.2